MSADEKQRAAFLARWRVREKWWRETVPHQSKLQEMFRKDPEQYAKWKQVILRERYIWWSEICEPQTPDVAALLAKDPNYFDKVREAKHVLFMQMPSEDGKTSRTTLTVDGTLIGTVLLSDMRFGNEPCVRFEDKRS